MCSFKFEILAEQRWVLREFHEDWLSRVESDELDGAYRTSIRKAASGFATNLKLELAELSIVDLSRATKDELQEALKAKFGINKNISQPLSRADCEQLFNLLEREPSASKLVTAFAQKNGDLAVNNRTLGQRRSIAERRYEKLTVEYQELEAAVQNLEQSTTVLEQRKRQLEAEQQRLQADVQSLAATNQRLDQKVEELSTANDQLKKDNKDLKNIVDAIRLRLARDTQELLRYEDSEIRRALIRLFRWTLG
jgi:chromosome segregation ATPase